MQLSCDSIIAMKTDICEQLAQKGHRRTQVRHLLHELLEKAEKPMSVPDLTKLFNQKNRPVNKTTLYREIEFYLDQGLVTEVQFNDHKKRYELAKEHHHHFVCNKCNKIIDLKLKPELSREIKRICNKLKITINRHNLEFYGLCQKCK